MVASALTLVSAVVLSFASPPALPVGSPETPGLSLLQTLHTLAPAGPVLRVVVPVPVEPPVLPVSSSCPVVLALFP